jgi:hypothetical protein
LQARFPVVQFLGDDLDAKLNALAADAIEVAMDEHLGLSSFLTAEAARIR